MLSAVFQAGLYCCSREAVEKLGTVGNYHQMKCYHKKSENIHMHLKSLMLCNSVGFSCAL